MNKQTMIIVILVVAAAIGITFLLQQPKKDRGTKKRIALFAPAIHPAMDEIFEGFTQTIQKDSSLSYSFDEYNAQGNPTLLRGQAEEIILGDYDLIFPIGATCTQTLYTLTKKKNITTPIVFTAVDTPLEMGIAQSLESSGNHLTGITTTKEFKKQLDLLYKVKPTAQNILLVYDPGQSGGQEEDRKQIAKLVEARNKGFQFVTILNANEIQQKVQSFMQSVDTVMILKDHTAVSGVDALITLCNRYGVTLYTSDHNSGQKGAALSYDVSEYEYGSAAAIKAKEILEKNKKPAEIPITFVQNRSLQINTKTMHKQGLDLSQTTIEQLQAQGVIVI